MEEKIFLVKYRHYSKKLLNPTLQNTKELFGIADDSEIFIQYFDSEFQDFIDTSWDELKYISSNKLKVYVENNLLENFPGAKRFKAACDEPVLPFKIIDHVPLSKQDSDDTIILELSDQKLNETSNSSKHSHLERQNAFCQNKNSCISVNLDDLGSTSYSHLSCVSDKGYNIQSRPGPSAMYKESSKINLKLNEFVTYGNLSTSYILPYISPGSKLGKALTRKENLSRSLKSELLSKIYESFTTKKIFYIGHQSIQIVNSLLNAYPHLGRNMTYDSAKHYWLRSLNFKFTNERVRTDFDEEAVIVAKATKQYSKFKSKCSTLWDVPNYYPLQSEDDEDDLTVESHKGWMKGEITKHTRNDSAISIRMNITFRDRRCLLFNENTTNPSNLTASDILQQYPCLSIEKEAICEVNRLFGEAKFYETYCNNIHDLSTCFYEHLLSSKFKYKTHLDSLFSSSNSLQAEEQKFLKLPAIISILLSEDPKDIIDTELSDSQAPMLQIVDNKASLIVDGTTFIADVSPINAAYLWTGSFYTFNVKTGRNKKTFEVLQKIIFDIPESPKWTHTHQKVIDIVEKYLVRS